MGTSAERRDTLPPEAGNRRGALVGWLCICLMLCGSCGKGFRSHVSILPEGFRLEEGDVVFRQGTGMAGRAVLMADGGGMYSHVGIVADSCGTKVVVHAVPGEPDFPGDPDRVKADAPERFFSSQYAQIGAVARCADEAVACSAARKAWETYKRGTLFDHDYDDRDTTYMYCTELVNFSYAQVGYPLAGSGRRHIELPGLKCDCLFPSDLLQSARLQVILSF